MIGCCQVELLTATSLLPHFQSKFCYGDNDDSTTNLCKITNNFFSSLINCLLFIIYVVMYAQKLFKNFKIKYQNKKGRHSFIQKSFDK